MTYTLFDTALALARIISDVFEGVASGGSTTTLVDSDIPSGYPNDHFNNGTIFLLSGNNASKSAIISDYDSTTWTFTFPTQAGACAANDRYGAMDADYPKHILVQSINKALIEIGDLIATNTALTTVEDQEEYTLPAGVYNVKRVEVAQYTTEPYGWQIQRSWQEREGKLIFLRGAVPTDDDLTIRLTYMDPPTELTADSDTISVYIHRERLAWMAATYALRWRVQLTDGEDERVVKSYEEALQMAELAKARHPVPAFMHRDANISRY